MWEWAIWPETLQRWRREGLPDDVEPQEYFEMDPIVAVGVDCSLQLQPQKLEETQDFTITRDADGVTLKAWKEHYATPVEIDFTIKERADWDRLKERLTSDEGRIQPDVYETLRQARQDEIFSICSPAEPIWWVLRTLGHEQALMLMATDPDWVEEMVRYQMELNLRLLQKLVEAGTPPDGLWYWADLCYKNGMLFSPATYRSLFMPYHKQITRFCRQNDIILIFHCDGDVRQFIPLLIEAGFEVIQPLEARCGNDVRELKPLYGDQIAFFGNIASDVLAKGGEALEHEVRSKVLAAKPGGGYVFHSDHSVPPTISLASYGRAVEICRELGTYE